ncbi:sigma-70 family RNA polymerase sigma factor [Saccharothrix algeriensis]|uniref:DNA-directed RNA polymerase specialized sigma24 family protein n=1 Tax=Saccharothrix algeriensis TaxID=173560 RepID=A0ABS2S4T2_9PSEU|nr:sigma-70 family RNA polymerase sigma factor [Saccharothrix algeriensis]MBM7811235.1 DNA-directed RNA polymerase specialized sigma24 family protein [Saccharothrix algeriensis]
MAGGGERFGGVPPRRVTDLQPDDRAGAHGVGFAGDEALADGAEVTGLPAGFGQQEWEPQFDADEHAAAAVAERQARYLRHEQDQLLYEEFVVAGFSGAKYEIFRGEMAAYALPVVRSWLRRGRIFDLTHRQGRPLRVTDHDRAGLEDVDERIGLAHETVAMALVLFHRRAVAGTGWSLDGGAALTTFFVGACVAVFPGVFRAWQRTRNRWDQVSGVRMDDVDPAALRTRDHADRVVSRERVVAELQRMDPKVREVAEPIVWHGSSHEEVAAELGVTPRSVEARLYRFRAERRRRRRGGESR